MKIALRWQVLWAPATALLVAMLLLVSEAAGHRRLVHRLSETSQMRQSLERAIARLDDRHQRTVRRANEAVLESHQGTREAMLAWTSEHYIKEMDNYGAEARLAIASAHIGDAEPRLLTDLERLRAQIDRILEQGHSVATALDALLAAVSAQDDDGVVAASQDLERADRAMDSLLRSTVALVRQLTTWQVNEALSTPATVPRTAWLLLLVWIPLSLFIGLRPLARISRLTQSGALGPALSPEEAGLQRRLTEQDVQHEIQSRQLAERTREAERATAAIRRVGQELALLKLYNENLVNSLRAAIIVTDVELRLRSFNRAARTLLALNDSAIDASLLEQPLFSALARQSRDAKGELVRAITERCTLHYEALPYPSTHGEVLLDLVVVPYMDESGTARGLLFVADDVTDTIRTKTQLLAAERLAAVGRLSAQVAHEIRNPLSAIGLNTELLREDFASDLGEPRRSEAAKLLAAISAEVERLTEVTEGYLQLSRLPRPNLRSTDVNQLVSDLTSMLREEMKAHGVVVQLELETPPPLVWADTGQLRQALLNVLRNSREAMPSGGSIRVDTSASASSTTIDVCDSGPGLAPEVLRRVFEPFFSTKEAGTGLGLSLTRQIVIEHAGEIRIENREGGGTRVRFVLPKSPTDAPDVADLMT